MEEKEVGVRWKRSLASRIVCGQSPDIHLRLRPELAAVVRVNSHRCLLAMTPMGVEICGRAQLVARALCRLEAISLCVLTPWRQSNGHAAQYYGESLHEK